MGIESIHLPDPGQLQFSAAKDDRARLKAAAQEFEALLIEAMLRSMRNSIQEEEESEESYGKDIYTDMMHQQLARAVSQGSGIGVAKLLEKGAQRQASEHNSQQVTLGSGAGPHASISAGVDTASRSIEAGENTAQTPTELTIPVSGQISSSYGWRRDPLDREERFHRGVDIAASAGAPIVAAEDGRVIYSGQGQQYGNVVVIEHANGLRTLYAHLSERTVEEGEVVSKLQPIGKVGSTGRSTGPHLHFEVYENRQLKDPRFWI